MYDAVIVGVPLIAILAGIRFNGSGLKALRAGINTRFGEMNNRFNKVEDHLGSIGAGLRQFYHLTGKLEARMGSIEKRS